MAKLKVDSKFTNGEFVASEKYVDIHAGNKANPHAVTKAQVGLGSVDNIKQAKDADVGNKVNLLTADKSTIVGAINEVFQTGNNVKGWTVGALLSVDESLPINSGSSWNDIIRAIGQISTGVQMASGTVVSSSFTEVYVHAGATTATSRASLTVTDLPFKPKRVSLYAEITGSRHVTEYSEETDTYYPKTAKVAEYRQGTYANQSTGNFKGDVSPAKITESSFTLPAGVTNGTYTWVAYSE